MVADALARRKAANLQRQTMAWQRRPGRCRPASDQNGPWLVDLASNDYLALSFHPHVRQTAQQWLERWGAGAGASPLVCGWHEGAARLEQRLAHLKQAEGALLFNSGWQANACLLPALDQLSRLQTGQGLAVFNDRLNHASLHHGCAAAGVRQKRFRHNDVAHLATLLEHHQASLPAGERGGLKIIATESVFSMDGDRAPLHALRALADRWGALLLVDEAHATGVLGPNGTGLTCASALEGGVKTTNAPVKVDITLSTASKALGGAGAFITGSKALREWLVNSASGYVYSTAPPPAALGALEGALDLLPTAKLAQARAALGRNAELLRQQLHSAGFETGASSTHIVPVMAGSAEQALEMAVLLRDHGFFTVAIRPPTVPQGQARLRLSLNAALEDKDLEKLCTVLRMHCRPTGRQGRHG
ncbi:8-amino-7-oxononanoate synthase [Formicincola oecophyllae]|uniref:8-amino-7-oxononanoate synthase n=2 Tax=Formicincola oecophyllae TaxID=2558361 RepID=A0A4Y6UA66_9PROT|nr:8-amino-7-oxononanoate synthase [Formicincola oecophyllae]